MNMETIACLAGLALGGVLGMMVWAIWHVARQREEVAEVKAEVMRLHWACLENARLIAVTAKEVSNGANVVLDLAKAVQMHAAEVDARLARLEEAVR